MKPIKAENTANTRLGVSAGLLSYFLWGIFPIYLKIVDSVPAVEVLMHRVVWAVPFGALILLFRRQFRDVRQVLGDRVTMRWLVLAALCITANWFIYIWAVQNERILEASLGYFINPLVNVLAGMLLFGERLRRLQGVAVLVAGLGVLVLSLSGGGFPWVSISLAVLFAAYGVIRKQARIGAMPGLFVETVMLFPFACAWLLWITIDGTAAFASGSLSLDGWLLLAGPFTVLPLLFFATAARNVPLTTLGFMQYLAPSVQFAIGLFYGETLSLPHMICFSLIWFAVLLFIIDAVRTRTKKPRAVIPAGA